VCHGAYLAPVCLREDSRDHGVSRWCLMARSEARIDVDIWTDPDFLALQPGAQRTFLFLVSQKDLAHDGVLALRERRWSRSAAGLSEAEVRADLAALEHARFIVLDEDAEELLIRSFIRRDKVYRQPNVLRAAADHLALVTSPKLLAALRTELLRIAEAEDIGESSKAIVQEMLTAIGNPTPVPTPNPPGKGSGNPSDMPTPGTPGVRGMVTAVSTGVSPSPGSPSRSATGGASLALLADRVPTAQTLVAEWIDNCRAKPPGRVIGQVAKQLRELLDEGIPPGAVRQGLAEWHRKGLHPSTLPSVVNELMNAGDSAARASPRRNDDIDWNAAMQRAAAREAAQ
jgi:hypothetical protein